MPARPRMDCVIVRQGDGLAVSEPRRLKAGAEIVMGEAEDGSQGVYVHTSRFPDRARTAATSSASCPPR